MPLPHSCAATSLASGVRPLLLSHAGDSVTKGLARSWKRETAVEKSTTARHSCGVARNMPMAWVISMPMTMLSWVSTPWERCENDE